MFKRKVAAVKLFDNRNPLIHNQCGRQERWCSCFLELTNHTPKLNTNVFKNIEHHQKQNYTINDLDVKRNFLSKINDHDYRSSKENYFATGDHILPVDIPVEANSEKELESQTNHDNKESIEVSITDSLEETSNSATNNCNIDFEVSSAEETSNSSWKDTSQEHLTGSDIHEMHSPIKNVTDVKAFRNTFPTVFNKKELYCHMNMCSDKDDIVIPIRYFRKFNDTPSRTDHFANVGIQEVSTDYDLDTDKLNTSLIDYPVTSNSSTSRTSCPKTTASEKIKSSFNIGCSRKPLNKTTNVSLYAYIADIKGIQESLILNKDRRFSRILERYSCKASIIQLRNLNRGFPHTLLKIECESKLNLNLMARDADRIHSSWNLRSQLRSIHAH